ncbi:MAG: FGGY-family carbohydrate kinase [Gemmataceae bacterium]|nr:FGGY-family carbohydrate kinase [Gemmataceae bacterium]MDW8265559.1 FGGY-family carbohydrate kinase [Gemmataceae bacterium]
MPEALRCVAPESLIVGWDFSTSGVKCLAFDLEGRSVAEVRLPTDLWTADGVSELNLCQLEGQARASLRGLVRQLQRLGRLHHWVAAGISATHHTAGRIDADALPIRRAICWNDHTLTAFHERGLRRLGGQEKARQYTGGPWAIRYSLSHLVKDEALLSPSDWRRTYRILPHGPLAAGYLTGNFDVISVSAAASTGLMDLRSGQWSPAMLEALEDPEHRRLALEQLPRIIDANEPVGPIRDFPGTPPLVFPTSDDQQAGLVGGGAVDAGQVAVILGKSAVVNSSSAQLPQGDTLDVMRLNWGPYLWMRCYHNGAQFLDHVVGPSPDWGALEAAARRVPAGCGGTAVWPFVYPEPSLGIDRPRLGWSPSEPTEAGIRFRAALEALAYLIALGVREHEAAGQRITRITVSGGIARSGLMCDILATVLDRPLYRLESDEGPALGAAVTALAGLETHRRRQQGIAELFTVADAVAILVKFRGTVQPVPAWSEPYRRGLEAFQRQLQVASDGQAPQPGTRP